MKLFSAIVFLFSFSVHLSAQVKALDALKSISNAFTSAEQDTTKKKSAGTQSNLAVTDEGVPSEKNKDSKKTITNPLEELKKKATGTAVKNEGGTVGGSNLAVTDEGVPNEKKETGKGSKTNAADTTGAKSAEPKAAGGNPK